jgi:threonine dehydratase
MDGNSVGGEVVEIDHVTVATQEVRLLVNAAKKSGKKDSGAISTLALLRIAEKHLLRGEEVINILSGIWRGIL